MNLNLNKLTPSALQNIFNALRESFLESEDDNEEMELKRSMDDIEEQFLSLTGEVLKIKKDNSDLLFDHQKSIIKWATKQIEPVKTTIEIYEVPNEELDSSEEFIDDANSLEDATRKRKIYQPNYKSTLWIIECSENGYGKVLKT